MNPASSNAAQDDVLLQRHTRATSTAPRKTLQRSQETQHDQMETHTPPSRIPVSTTAAGAAEAGAATTATAIATPSRPADRRKSETWEKDRDRDRDKGKDRNKDRDRDRYKDRNKDKDGDRRESRGDEDTTSQESNRQWKRSSFPARTPFNAGSMRKTSDEEAHLTSSRDETATPADSWNARSHGRQRIYSESKVDTIEKITPRRDRGRKIGSSMFLLNGGNTPAAAAAAAAAAGSGGNDGSTAGSTSTMSTYKTANSPLPSMRHSSSVNMNGSRLSQHQFGISQSGRQHRYGFTDEKQHNKNKRSQNLQELVLPKHKADLLRKRQQQGYYDPNLIVPGRDYHGNGRIPPATHPPQTSSQHASADTQSAQMVNLVLRLSATRRDHHNMVGSLPSRSVASNRWPMLEPSKLSDTRYNRYSSPSGPYGNSGAELYTPAAAHPPVARNREEPLSHVATLEDELVNLQVSDATIARAEKARKHFELFAEYLKILHHLPPLRSRPVSAAPSASSSLTNQLLGEKQSPKVEGGRPYNPLQYIRNRKVRFREKCPIDTAAEGWEDVGQVRKWVNTIIENQQASNYDVTECLDLPDVISMPAEGTSDSFNMPMSRVMPATKPPTTGDSSSKVKRPRVDWIANPADLLGDVAWLERDDNKLKIEDKDGNKVFPRDTTFRRINLRKDAVPQSDSHEALPYEKRDEKDPSLRRLAHYNRSGSQIRYSSDASRSKKGWRSATTRYSESRSQSRGRSRQRYEERDDAGESGYDETPSRLSRLRDRIPGIRTLYGSRSRPANSSESEGSDSDLEMTDEEIEALRYGPRQRRRDRYKEYLPHIKRRDDFRDSLSILDQLILQHRADSDADEDPRKWNERAAQAAHLKADKRRSLLSPINTDVEKGFNNEDTRSRVRRHKASTSIDESDGENLRRQLLDRQRDARIQPPSDSLHAQSPSRPIAIPDVTISLSPSPSRPSSRTEFSRSTSIASPSAVGPPRDRRKQDAPSSLSLQSSEAVTSTGYDSPIPRRESRDHLTVEFPGKTHSHSGSSLHRFFRGSRLAGVLSHEASRVGDLIRRRDGHVHSGHSSVSSLASLTDKEAGDSGHLELRRSRPSRSRLVTFPEDAVDPLPLKPEEDDGGRTPKPASPSREEAKPTKKVGAGDNLAKQDSERSRSPGHVVPDTTESLAKPKRTSTDIEKLSRQSPAYSDLADIKIPAKHRDGLSEERLGFTSKATPGRANLLLTKREIDRVEAHFHASGVRAYELNRQINEVDDLPTFLLRLIPNEARENIPATRRCEHATTAAHHVVSEFDRQARTTHQMATNFTRTTLPELRSSVDQLLRLANCSLNSRIRSTTLEADNLTSQLATTDTLAVKKLHDELDRGMRQRSNRFRWVSSNGYRALEWFLIAVMWFVWFFVMIWKVMRMLFRVTVHGMRWVLWL
ncbi:hypothetical protein KEM54_003773 [Ascosphaera aggregata]|nr:hypothetical protein KEM54_003773 [Ascosphaera aggregata]